ncbi:MAG: hypothetical protein WA952_11360 [Lewinella sp.]
MKYLFLTCYLVLAVTLSAQQTSVKVYEYETDNSYTYSIRSNDITAQMMNTVFSEITDMNVEGKVSGKIENTLDDGVEVSVNTRRKRFRISYKGTDEAALAHAKALAVDLQDRLQSEPPRR